MKDYNKGKIVVRLNCGLTRCYPGRLSIDNTKPDRIEIYELERKDIKWYQSYKSEYWCVASFKREDVLYIERQLNGSK